MSAAIANLTQTPMATLDIHRVAGSLGAEIRGLHLSGDLTEDIVGAIKTALHAHKVIFFRGQSHLDDAEHRRFSALLGDFFDNPGLPEDVIAKTGSMYELDGSKPDGRAESWHTDSTFCLAPPSAAILRGVVIPPYGGDTSWANCVQAYETLTPSLRNLADQLWAVHSNKFDYAAMRPNSTRAEREHFDKVTTAHSLSAEHPLVRVHPRTGERALMVGKYAQRIAGHSAAESDRLKAIFQDHIIRLANTVRWRWTQGDVVIWDNQATQHCVINDWGVQPRIVRRWTLAGDIPVGVDGHRSFEPN